MPERHPTQTASRWAAARSFHHDAFDEALFLGPRPSVSVCVPAREEAAGVGGVVEALAGLRERGLVDEVVVIDAASADGTAEIAAAAGAEVRQQADLLPRFGAVRGKGDAMWRALSVLTGDVVCFVDADTREFGPHFALGLAGPLIRDPDLAFVKGYYRRPFQAGEVRLPHGGGRVNDLAARPLLSRFFPELAAVRQPLAGEFAARRELLDRLPFPTGYGVEIGLLIDAYRDAGLDALAQVDLGVRQNAHQSLAELGPMAAAVLGAVVRRLEQDGRVAAGSSDVFLTSALEPRDIGVAERPPYGTIGSRRRASSSRSPSGSSRSPATAARTAR